MLSSSFDLTFTLGVSVRHLISNDVLPKFTITVQRPKYDINGFEQYPFIPNINSGRFTPEIILLEYFKIPLSGVKYLGTSS